MNLLDEAIDADLAAIEVELEQLQPQATSEPLPQQPKRAALPAQLPRTEIRHDPQSTVCQCGCERVRIGEDISEKLDYTPGVFTVERHIRGKWVCRNCETLIQACGARACHRQGHPDCGTAGVSAGCQVRRPPSLVYRQEQIFARAGVAIPRSTLGAWVGMCGVQLQPLVDALHQEIPQQGVLHAVRRRYRCSVPAKARHTARICGRITHALQ